MTIQEWLVNNSVQIATLITLVAIGWRMSRWSGVVDTRIDNLEGWLKGHVEHHPGEG